MKKIWKVIFYLGLFFLFLIWNLWIQPLNLDEVWNYGFAHSIYMGLVPYRDFNMILTPLYSMVMALPFFIFGSNMLVLHIEQAVFLTITCYFLFQLVKNYTWLLLLLFFFPLSLSFPSYNSFLLFLYVIVIYLEKKDGNDYLIGLLLGAFILTKQSVGVCLLLPSLYYFSNKKKILKRMIGCMIPVCFFFLYLLGTHSLSSFLDLCVFGLFDFAAGNGKLGVWFIGWLLLMGGTFLYMQRHEKSIYGFYSLAFYSVMIPLFDVNHFQLALFVFLLFVFDDWKIKIPVHYAIFSLISILGIFVVTISYRFSEGIVYPNKLSHFEYRLLEKDDIKMTEQVNQYLLNLEPREVVFLNSNAYYFRLIHDDTITYLDLINVGNWGYHGSDKLLSSVKKKKNAVFMIDTNDLSDAKQTDKRVLTYIMKHGKKIKTIRFYDFYVLQ